MSQTEIFSWAAAILLSLLLHSMLLMQSGTSMGVENAPLLPASIVTRLNFNKAENKPMQEAPRAVEKKPVKTLKKVELRPLKKKKIKQKAVPVKTIEAVSPPELFTAPVTEAQVLVSQPGQQANHSTEILLREKRQQYLYKLLTHIESFKYYPRAARRRGVEGEMKVSLTLLDDGAYKQLTIDGEHNVLVQATTQALESAIPLPAPPGDIGLSRQIEFTMVYSLRN